jgi:hypothetical protein
MTDIVVIFQNCSNLMEHAPHSYSEPCYDVTQFLHVKVQEVTHIQEEEDTHAVPFPVIKTEHEVSFMPVCPLLDTFHRPACFIFLHTCHPNESAPLLCVDFSVFLRISHHSICFTFF